MKRKAREGIARLSYAHVEAALARIFDAEHVQKAAFRGRLKHFRKLGIPRHNPGKGARVAYGMPDIYQLMICLELSELGIDPNLVAKLVHHHWDINRRFPAAIAKARELHGSGDDLWIAIPANFMSQTWGERFEQSDTHTSYRSGRLRPVWEVRDFRESESNEFLKVVRNGRALVFNLSSRLRNLEVALKESVS